MPEFDVELDRVATGGASIGPSPDGRLAFVTGALPGERVRAATVAEHRTRIEARAVEVIEPSPLRRPAPCNHVAEGCGGCDWQHAEPELQRKLRQAIVVDCLTRLGTFTEPDVRPGPTLDPAGYRTTVRAAVHQGRAGFRKARSNEVVITASCLTAHPRLEPLLVEGRFGQASEVSLRVGARTGDRLAIVRPTAEGVRLPDDVIVVGDDELRAGREVFYHEEILGRTLRISANSFFQCRPDGAEALIALVRAALGDTSGLLLDAYCGVGLFGAALLDGPWDSVLGVESSPSSSSDAVVNYGAGGRVERERMERWRARPVGAIVADPTRTGLGKATAATLAETRAPVIALVSCDPASLARDAALLGGHGYELDHVSVVDLFGNTSHVETVSRLVRRRAP